MFIADIKSAKRKALGDLNINHPNFKANPEISTPALKGFSVKKSELKPTAPINYDSAFDFGFEFRSVLSSLKEEAEFEVEYVHSSDKGLSTGGWS